MPEPVKGDQKYLPGLDGLRALAVAAVVAYHLGYGWAQGGLLGVGVFFTLSGYLITDILVGQWAARGRIRLGDFWLRRARRLLPALFVMLAVVTVWVNALDRAFIPGFRGNVFASMLYVSNWWYIDQHASYYARFAPPAPLDHLWSLAVEEQFYLVWPWVVLLVVWLASLALRRRRRPATAAAPYLTSRSRLAVAGVTLALAAVSAVLMARLYQPGYDPTRVYEGTDTRAFGLLIGAAVAVVWPTRRPVRPGAGAGAGRPVPAWARWLLDAAGVAGLATIGLLVWRTNEYSGFMFRDGLVLLSVATAATVAAAVTPGSLLGRALGCWPLRWLGVRSYGIYLWHYPVILLTAAAGSAGGPVSPLRAAALVVATLAVAAVSWRVIEEPIRRGARLRWVGPARTTEDGAAKAAEGASMTNQPDTGGRKPRRRGGLLQSPQVVGGLCLIIGAVLAAGVTASVRLNSHTAHTVASPRQARAADGGLASGTVSGTGTTDSGATTSAELATSGTPRPAAAAGPPATAGPRGGATAPGATAAPSLPATAGKKSDARGHQAPASGRKAAAAAPAPRTSCTSVVHIGDSTSEGLISADYEPNPANRIPARYADVGVKKSVMKIVGATSIVESLPGTPNAYDMADQLKKSGFHGCWVLALGTNDTADVYAGSNVGRVQRIQKMMNLIGSQPVMWVEVTSLLSSGPYAEQNMQLWNQALHQVLPRYPQMRIYDWPAVAQKSWFISDGIHYTSSGYAHRAVAIADALAAAFPAR